MYIYLLVNYYIVLLDQQFYYVELVYNRVTFIIFKKANEILQILVIYFQIQMNTLYLLLPDILKLELFFLHCDDRY